MRYRRTQVYLDPEDHRELSEEAHRRGISLTALIREIVSRHRTHRGAPAAEKSFDDLVGIICEGPPSDIRAEEDRYEREAAEARTARKLPSE